LLFRCLFITAGVYFSAINLHRALGYWVLYNPLIHLLEQARQALYPGYPVFEVSLWYPLAWAFGLTLAGLVLNRYSKRWKKD
jgi:ABC-type polysaccharide/polyol phosphate export permease